MIRETYRNYRLLSLVIMAMLSSKVLLSDSLGPPKVSSSGAHELIEAEIVALPGDDMKEIRHVRDTAKMAGVIREELIYAQADPKRLVKRVSMLANRVVIEVLSDRERVLSILQERGYRVVANYGFSKVIQIEFPGNRIKDHRSAMRELRRLSRDGHFRVAPDYLARLQATVPDDPDFVSEQTDLQLIGAADAWDITTGDSALVVALIDSGMQVDHEDLSDNLFINPNEIPDHGLDDDGNGLVDDLHGWDFANDDNSPEDLVGHGTAMAGVIGAVGNNSTGIAGTSWKCQLLPLKAGDDPLVWSAIIHAIDYAIWL